MDRRFLLSPKGRHPITVLDDVSVVRLQLGERVPVKQAKKRAKTATGTLLAVHASPNVGDLHSPFDGVITDITSTFIEVERVVPPPAGEKMPDDAPAKTDRPDLTSPAVPVSFDELDELELVNTLKNLGISVRPFTRPCDLFIINCLNPEPGMLYTQEILSAYMPIVEAGFGMLRRLNNAPKFILALPEGSGAVLEGTEVRYVKPEYPNSLARLLIRLITGSGDTSRVSLARLHALFQLGLVARSGLPLTHTVTTAFGNNYFIPLGTPIAVLLEKSGLSPARGDTLMLGGAMRGVAISGMRRGIRKGDDAVQLARRGSRPELEDNPCINCGACVSVCPMRLRPNMLSRYAEFEQYDACRKEYIEACIECGMCGYICPACRPIQQHFRMAKNYLGITTLQHQLRK